ncbi:thiamine phosphate synthase [Fodinicurvata halophila]|uniref:Thiamine-phosphate synthase n=1 Tax=Fodinicurvata halophila TaxID=1419723 RepID=A0ABV8UPM8_9PROT
MVGKVPELLVISDRHQARHDLEQIAERTFSAGLRNFMLRDKDLANTERRALAERLCELACRHLGRVLINGDWSLAAEVDAAGVHLQHPGDIPLARAALGDAAVIGVSAHSRKDIVAAAAEGADYATLSPVFATESKPGYGPALELDGLRRMTDGIAPPVLALGGVTAANARDCLSAGATGLAVMGEVMRAEAPEETVRQLLQAIRGSAPGTA